MLYVLTSTLPNYTKDWKGREQKEGWIDALH